ncbi:MAG: acylphosphatase [Balneolales bacterium]
MQKRVNVIIKGRVQGVGYRYFVKQKAGDLELNGWVRNLKNGHVEAMFEGDPSRVQEMLKACREGPRPARVDEIEVKENQLDGELNRFEII